MRNLLREGVSIRDPRMRLESLLDAAPGTRDPEQLTELVRQSQGLTPCLITRPERRRLRFGVLSFRGTEPRVGINPAESISFESRAACARRG